MTPEERLRAMADGRQRLAERHRAIVDTLRPGDPKDPAVVATLERLDAEIEELNAGIADLAKSEKRAAECAELYMRDAHLFGNSAATSTNRFGGQLRDAIGEVMDGKATAFVDVPRNVLTEAGSAGDGVPTELKAPVSTLAASSVVMSLPGIRVESVTSDRARYPRLGAATVDGVAEGATLTAANTQTDSVTVVAQKYGVLETLTSELLEDYSSDALAAFGGNLMRRLALRVDAGLLEGDGASDVVGIRNVVGANATSVAATPANFAKFRTAELELLTDDGVPVVWVMHPRTWATLAGIKTGIASDETTLLESNPQQGPRSLLGHPVRFSTQLTLTEGAGAGSWAALLDTSQMVVLERRPARLEVSRDFKFDEDVIAIRATWRGGLAVLNAEAVSLLTDIRA